MKHVIDGDGKAQARGKKKDVEVYEPYHERVEELLKESDSLPRKQRYMAAKITELLRKEGYEGCASRLRQEVGKWRKKGSLREMYLPLSFEPGQDAQCEWGQALVVLAGREVEVQVFVMLMCYSRRLFVMVFPSARRECFLTGNVEAFAYFGGEPGRISYNNVATAVRVTYEQEESKREENCFGVIISSIPIFVLLESHTRKGESRTVWGIVFGICLFRCPEPRVMKN